LDSLDVRPACRPPNGKRSERVDFDHPAVAAGTTTTVSSSAANNESFSGASVTFTATVTSGGNAVAEGTVTFTDGKPPSRVAALWH
jgi:hypothetical protein